MAYAFGRNLLLSSVGFERLIDAFQQLETGDPASRAQTYPPYNIVKHNENDYMIGKMASGPFRARIYGVRYVVSFTVLAAALPLIAFVHQRWGFDTLFLILAGAAAATIAVVSLLPRELPAAA